MVDTLISYHRGGLCVTCRRKPFSQTYIREEMIQRHLVGTDLDPGPTCKAFVWSVVVLFLSLNPVY